MASPSTPKFVLFTTPIRLEGLDVDSRQCPICTEPYIEPQETHPTPEDTQEWAMRVDMSATDERTTKCCRHIIGRRCLQKHINSRGAWHNKCPLCRQEWWISDPSPPRSSLPEPVSRRSRIRTGRIGRRSSGSMHRQQRPPRSNFIRQVLDEFAVQDGSEHIEATVQEVEERLAVLYNNRDSRQGLGAERISVDLNRNYEPGETHKTVDSLP